MEIVFFFYDGMTALDIIGPHEVLWRLPNITVKRVAKQKGIINTYSAGLTLVAEYSLFEINNADVLLVPGAGNATSLQDDKETLDWIRMIHTKTIWTTSVCTGSLILGAAGILNGGKATSHWAAIDRLKACGAHPINRRIVEDGKVITAAGVSAGIDMALFLAAKISGEQTAKELQLALEYDPEPPFDVGSPNKADPLIVDSLRQRMQSLFESQH